MTEAEQIAAKLSRRLRRAIAQAEEIFIGELSVSCSDDDLYELALDGIVNDNEGDALTPFGMEVRAILMRDQ